MNRNNNKDRMWEVRAVRTLPDVLLLELDRFLEDYGVVNEVNTGELYL